MTPKENMKFLEIFLSMFDPKKLKIAQDKTISFLKENVLVILVISLFFILLFRNINLYPRIFADEYTYSTFSRLREFSHSTIPGYLYLMVYRITNVCGDNFLDCVKILNIIFFVCSIPFIYSILKKVSNHGIALLITLLTVLGPINSYTTYFMPESLFFFSFWLFVWFILQLDNVSKIKMWSLGGVLLGFCSLIKPHALLFLPAIIIYIFYISRQRDVPWVPKAIRDASIFAFFVFFTKLLIGYGLAGTAGITIFGSTYTSIAVSSVTSLEHYVNLIVLSIKSLKGHVLAISLLFSVPVAIMVKSLFYGNEKNEQQKKMSFFSIIVLLNLVLITVIFTSLISVINPEELFRLHMRYYNFAFPLFFIITASQLFTESVHDKIKQKILIAIPIGLIIVYAIHTKISPYKHYLIDSPELFGFIHNATFFCILSGVSMLSIILWVYRDKIGIKFFIYIFMPITIIASTFFANQELRKNATPNIYDRTGMFMKQYLATKEEFSKVLIVGSDPVGLYQTLFYIDNEKASVEIIPIESVYDISKIPAEKEWVVIIGNYHLLNNTFETLQMNNFTLIHTINIGAIDFKKSTKLSAVSSIQGLSETESWGVWSHSNIVTFEFSKQLPEKFNIHLTAHAFGPNIDEEITASVGSSEFKFLLKEYDEEKILEFNNPDKSNILKINIPNPISPKELGLNNDNRKIGIGFVKLSIIPLK